MTTKEHLLTILAEECNEVAQRCAKALRFSPAEVQPGQPLTNSQRIEQEMADLLGVYQMCVDAGLVEWPGDSEKCSKELKVANFLHYSRDMGALTDPLV